MLLRVNYGECSKITNALKFLFVFSTIRLVIMAGIHKMLVRLANREDPDQKQSDLGLHCLSRPFCRTLVLEILENLP